MSRVAEGLVLALAASVALNGGFLLQHAGSRTSIAVSPRHPVATLSSLLRSPLWSAGTALGLGGWAVPVAALARAPPSLVHAVVGGGVAAVATVGAFFAFQRGLQIGRPLVVIALMTAATNVGSVAGGFLVFGDELGRTAPLAALHLAAFCLVFVAAWLLAPVQAALQEGAAV